MSTPTAPGTDWQEVIPADEAARFARYAEQLAALQRKHARGGKLQRALHTKANVSARAEFEVLSDLPEHARQGLFAQPAKYDAYVRYSNGQGVAHGDRTPDVRGIGIKLVGVAGKKLTLGMQDERTQDFLLIKTKSAPFRNADEFVAFVLAGENQALFLPRAFMTLGVRRTFAILRGMLPSLMAPVASLATTHYYTPLPSRLGPYAVHHSLTPDAKNEPGAKPGAAREYLGEEMASRLRNGPVSYDFQLQFYLDADRTPIEDSSVEWQEAQSPWITVARLRLPQQDVSTEQGRRLATYVETLSFDPFHAREDMKPLGNMMRARNYAYRSSTQGRAAAGEPDGSESP
jgi:hypothetical protein